MATQHTSSCSKLLAFSALVCLLLLVVHPAPVHGMRRAELLMGPGPAPALATAAAPYAAASRSAGIDTMAKWVAATAATTLDAAAQMSKWRVRRGSDPIHNRS